MQAAPNVQVEQPDLVRTLGFAVLAFYVFLIFSRVHDFVSFLHLPLVVKSIALVLMLLSGRLWPVLKTRTAILFLVWTAWMVIGVPFSVWPGGAANIIQDQWLQQIILFFLVSCLATSVQQVRRLVFSAGLGVFVASVTALVFNKEVVGRVAIGNMSRLGDPNDLAQFILFGVTLLFGVATGPVSRLSKFLLYVAMIPMAINFVKTGSRGGLVGLVAVMIVAALTGTPAQRLRVLIAGGIVVIVSLAFAPAAIRARYMELLKPESQLAQTEEAEIARSSAEGRWELFKRSLEITIKNPILGVGTGMFAVAENDDAMKVARRGSWHDTHNMFSQVSSENGIPGLIFFLSLLIGAYRVFSRLYRAGARRDARTAEVSRLAYWLRLAMVGFIATGTFLSVGYSELFCFLVGIALALRRSAEEEAALGERPVQAAPAQPSISSKLHPAFAPGLSGPPA